MCPGQGDVPCSLGCLWAVAIWFNISKQTALPLLPHPKGATGKSCELRAVTPVWHKPSLPQQLHHLDRFGQREAPRHRHGDTLPQPAREHYRSNTHLVPSKLFMINMQIAHGIDPVLIFN